MEPKMYPVLVTAEMAKRMLQWLEREGIQTFFDVTTVDNLVDAANKKD